MRRDRKKAEQIRSSITDALGFDSRDLREIDEASSFPSIISRSHSIKIVNVGLEGACISTIKSVNFIQRVRNAGNGLHFDRRML